jgi:PAS domain-containing protein
MNTPKTKSPDRLNRQDDYQAGQYARSLIEASLDSLVTISPEGKITDVNEATVKVTGVAR